MDAWHTYLRGWPAVLCAVLALLSGGCINVGHMPDPSVMPVPSDTARELCKTALPPYTIEPPDILVIDAVNVVPKPPYHLRTGDSVAIQVTGTYSDAPISGTVTIEPGGLIKLGARYGSVKISGLTTAQAEEAIAKHLRRTLREPVVSVSLAEIAARQQISGQHLVKPDGTVTLGSYGSVSVVGMTIEQAKKAVEKHLSAYLEAPEVSLDVFAYNSKMYYIITQGAGMGDQVYPFPITGNETVLDAIGRINGLGQVSSKKIWIARPSHDPSNPQILPVRWDEITAMASARSNYQLLPGDRVFVAEDHLVALDTQMAKVFAPFERVCGVALLGVGTVTRFSGKVLAGGGNPQSNF